MPSKRTKANVSRRGGDKGEAETVIISEDHDSPISSVNDDDILDDDDDISGGDEDSAGDEENASPNKSVARTRAATRKKTISRKTVVKKKLRATPKETYEDLEDLMDDPDKMIEYARRVPQLERDLADARDLLKSARNQLGDARENTKIAQKQAANTQKMLDGYRKQVIDEKKTESARYQTVEAELARIRKEIFSAQQAETKHQHSIEMAEQRTSLGVVGQFAKLNNSTNTKNQEKQANQGDMLGKYQLMMGNSGMMPNFASAFCGAQARGVLPGMMGIQQQQFPIQQAMMGMFGQQQQQQQQQMFHNFQQPYLQQQAQYQQQYQAPPPLQQQYQQQYQAPLPLQQQYQAPPPQQQQYQAPPPQQQQYQAPPQQQQQYQLEGYSPG